MPSTWQSGSKHESASTPSHSFGGIDAVICNASAIHLSPTESTSSKKWDLMHAVNVRGTYLVCHHAIPHLRKSANPHILVLSPPPLIRPAWFAGHTPYAVSKYGMSMLVLGLSQELGKDGIAVNALWPKTVIQTSALQVINSAISGNARKPEIVAEAAYVMLCQPSTSFTGVFAIDELVLRGQGVKDFSRYLGDGVMEEDLMPDLFVEPTFSHQLPPKQILLKSRI